MKHVKIYILVALPVMLGIGLFSAHPASANSLFFGLGHRNATPEEITSRHLHMFQEQADLLGIPQDDVKNAWAEGKSMADLMKEKGVTEEQVRERQHTAQIAQQKSTLSTLVARSVLTQAQADKRLALVQKQLEQMKGKKKTIALKKMHRGWRF